MILNMKGFSAFPAHDVDEAVRIASERAIDVAFVELLIGETNAIDAALRILAVRPYCRIVIWTGQPECVASWVRREADEQFGGCEVLFKPIDPLDIMGIARGEPIAYFCAIPDNLRTVGVVQPEAWVNEEDCLSGLDLHEYLVDMRERVLKLKQERNSWHAPD
jgi:ActR/RegA family two-component response regulator